jgi:hypothetical protein
VTDDTERTAVRTYVPAYQKAEWRSHAERLNMSQSEFVRTMVQAGRSDFTVAPDGATPADRGHSPDPDDGGGEDPLRDRVLDVLADGGHHSWEDLLSSLTDDIEDRLDETLQDLQSDGRIRYSGRHGGYAVEDDGD